jgi:Flp pilus assembly protein, ATPase CpaF
MDPEALRERVLADVRDQLAQETGISRDDRQRIALEVTDDILGHGPLERLLADESVTEIMVNGPYDIWIERGGRSLPNDVVFNDEWHLRRIINKMVAQVGRRIDESSPMVDARLPDGSRVNAVIPPLSLSGPLITIRKFSRAADARRHDQARDAQPGDGRVPPALHQRLSSTCSSRAEPAREDDALNALSTAIPNEERIVTIEDAAELRLNQTTC